MELAIIALIGTLFGGAGLKVIEHFLNRKGDKEDHATQLRNELRTDLARYKEEVREEAQDADKWQAAYYELKAEMMIVNHKANKVIETVDNKHPESHLGEDLKGLEFPGK